MATEFCNEEVHMTFSRPSTPPINLLVIPLGRSYQWSHQLTWPVFKDDGLLHFETCAGEVCISRSDWSSWQYKLRWPFEMSWGEGEQTRQLAWFDDLPEKILECFRNLRSVAGLGRVEVSNVKAGPTPASRKVTLNILVKDPDQSLRKLRRIKTVPFSLLDQGANGITTLPLWFVKKSELIGDGEVIATHPWVGLERLKSDITQKVAAAKAAYLEVVAGEQKAQEKREALQKAQDEQKAALAAEREKVRETIFADGEPVLAFARAKFNLAELGELGVNWDRWPDWILSDGPNANDAFEKLPRLISVIKGLPDYQVWLQKNEHKRGHLLKRKAPKERKARQPDKILENCSVEWVEWVGTSKNPKRTDHLADGCTVHFFGKKCEIELPSGAVITKMQGANLKIVVSP